MKGKLVIIPVSEIIEALAEQIHGKFVRLNSNITLKIHSIDSLLERESSKIDSSFFFVILSKDFLYGHKDNIILQHQIISENSKRFVFSFRSISFEHYADMCIHHMLQANEFITCSQTYLTSEWPLYILGTSLGKIFVCPFHSFLSIQCYNFHHSPITCIYVRSEKMFSCCKQNYMCVWELESNAYHKMPDEMVYKDKVKRRSSQALHFTSINRKEFKNYEPVKTIKFYFGSVTKIIRVEGLRDEKPVESINLLLGQANDHSLVVICLILGQAISFFPPISNEAKEAYYHFALDYLYVVSESNELYIFNIASNTLERMITGIDLYSILRKAPRNRIATETFEEVVEETSAKQRIAMFNLRQLFPVSTSAALKVSKLIIGRIEVPLLTINVQQILKKIKKVESPSAQLEYLLSLLTC